MHVHVSALLKYRPRRALTPLRGYFLCTSARATYAHCCTYTCVLAWQHRHLQGARDMWTTRPATGCRQPMDEPCAVARHGKHVPGRGRPVSVGTIVGRTRASNHLKRFCPTQPGVHHTLDRCRLRRPRSSGFASSLMHSTIGAPRFSNASG